VFDDDASARRTTVVEAIKTGKTIVGVEPGREALSIFGMTPIVRDGKTLANVDVGAAFGKEFVDRAKKRFGIDLAVYSYDGKEFKKLSSTFGDGVVTTPTSSRACSTASPCAATHARRPARRALSRQIKNYAGQPVGILEIIKDTTEYEAAGGEFAAQPDPRHGRHPDRRDPAGVAARPRACRAAGRHHGGHEPPFRRRNRRHDPGSERRDELGTMASAVDVFRRSMIEARRHARGAGGLQASDRTREEGALQAPDGRPLRG
jgi:methyl-accepting chemotaxis protein